MKTWQGDTGGPISLNHPLYKGVILQLQWHMLSVAFRWQKLKLQCTLFLYSGNVFKSTCTASDASKLHK